MGRSFTRRDVLWVASSTALAGLAGCTTGGPEPADGQSGTPTATRSPTETEAVSYPEGWSQDGLSDAETVLETHRSALGTRSYTFTFESVVADGMYDQLGEMVGRVDPGAERAFVHRRTVYDRNSAEGRRVENTYRYVTGDTEYVKVEDTDRENRYERGDHSFEDERHQIDDDFLEYVTMFEYAQTSVDRTRDPMLIRYAATDPESDAKESFRESWNDAAEADAGSELGVRTTGVLAEFGMNVGTVDETEYVFDLSGDVTGIGETTVEEPSWLEEARSATSTET